MSGKLESEVILGDSLTTVIGFPNHSIGGVISDPPFFIGIGRDDGGLGSDPWNNISSIESAVSWCRPHMLAYRQKVRKGGAVVVMAGVHGVSAWMQAAEEAGLAWMAEMMVLWNTGKPRIRNFGSLHTHVLWFAVPGARHTWNSQRRSIYSIVLVFKKVPINDRLHPAQKPIELTTFLISLLTRTDDLVLDPFCGSGSTLVSAVINDRPYIGIDNSPKYATMARRRALHYELENDNPIYLWCNNQLTEI